MLRRRAFNFGCLEGFEFQGQHLNFLQGFLQLFLLDDYLDVETPNLLKDFLNVRLRLPLLVERVSWISCDRRFVESQRKSSPRSRAR